MGFDVEFRDGGDNGEPPASSLALMKVTGRLLNGVPEGVAHRLSKRDGFGSQSVIL